MYKIFEEEIEETLEVYMDDMIIKSNKEEMHDGTWLVCFVVFDIIIWRTMHRNTPSELKQEKSRASIWWSEA